MEFNFETCCRVAATNPDYRFEPEHLPELESAFKRWMPGLTDLRITAGKQAYALVYIADAEPDIALQMQENPALAWSMASLAYVMLKLKMETGLGASGCLPFPPIEGELALDLDKRGLLKQGRLKHRFSMLTFAPAEQGCSRCALANDCPRIVNN